MILLVNRTLKSGCMMDTLRVWDFLLILISILCYQISAQDGTTCPLPDKSGSSTCVRIHYCDSFTAIVRKYSGNPPASEREFILKHSCGGKFVCCPDNAAKVAPITPSTPAPTKATTARPPIAIATSAAGGAGVPPLSDLNVIQNHRNINLVNQKCGSSSTIKIIGGHVAELAEFPWMALLQFKARLPPHTLTFNCGGALISSQYVLTAAHCVFRDLVAVRLGEHTISMERDCYPDLTPGKADICLDPVQDIQIEKFIKHPNYNNGKKINDIALLGLASPADLTKKNVRTICLPITPEIQIEQVDVKARENMVISGWGKIENGSRSDVLLKAFVPFVKNGECAQRFASAKIPIYDSYLCAGGVVSANKTDTCQGDSGGPIQTFGTIKGLPKMVLYGVVSVGVACLDPDVIYPGIYTSTAHYLDWILDNMSQ